jgi:hypothetical protein
MATFSATQNATILPDDQQQAKDDAAQALAASKPAPAPPVTNVTNKIEVPDVFVDVGSTNVKIESPSKRADGFSGERSIDYDRDENGNLVAKIRETRTTTIRKSE